MADGSTTADAFEDEAVRDLCRARDGRPEDLQRARHRFGKLLLRRGLHYSGRNWTRAHRQWIHTLEWTQPAERVVVDDYLLAIDHVEARLIELDARLPRARRRIRIVNRSAGCGAFAASKR